MFFTHRKCPTTTEYWGGRGSSDTRIHVLKSGNRDAERLVSSGSTGSGSQSSWILLNPSLGFSPTLLALGFHPILLLHYPRGEEIRLTLNYCFCSVNLLSSVWGRNEVLKACLLRPWWGCDKVQRAHPKAYAAPKDSYFTYYGRLSLPRFLQEGLGRMQRRWAWENCQVAEFVSNPWAALQWLLLPVLPLL